MTNEPYPIVTLRVPAMFFLDHANRQCVQYSGEPRDYIVSENKLSVVVKLDQRDALDLWDDARYYAGWSEDDYYENRSICNSARSTLKALARQSFGEEE